MNRRLVPMALVLAMACAGGTTGTDPTGADGPQVASTARPSRDGDGDMAEPVLLAPSSGLERAGPVADAPVSELASGFNNAGFELWRTQAAEDNLVFSPASIGHALLMARAAADEPTAALIDRSFGLPSGLGAHEAWNTSDQLISAAADGEDQITVSIADRIWPRLDVKPDQTWVDLLAAQHGITTEKLDFRGDPDGSRETINSWVGDQTEGLIPELLPKGFIHDRTVLVLTDAIYFKAQWQTVFGKYSNVEGTFTLLDGSNVETEYLRELELADRRGAGEGFVGAEIPYVGGDFSMLVIVPDAGRFQEIRDRLDQDMLDEIDRRFDTGPFKLLIPKWSSTTELDLVDWLTEIGAAPGGYPSIASDAYLDAAVHGADVTVDEWGTVAAAATALGFAESGPPEPEMIVKADRPFLYLIRHRPSGMVLFAGQVTNPAA